jgi:hypothetical protein
MGLHAQSTNNKSIRSIIFQGLKKNKKFYLDQFVESKIGTNPVDSLLHEDIQRLKNIPGIGEASYTIHQVSDQSVDIVFQIEELKTLLPIVNFGGVKDNLWFQLGLQDINWQGNGSTFSAVYQNRDKRHGGQLFYKATRIKASDWGFSATLNSLASLEPLFFDEGAVNYDYNNYELGSTIIKQFDFRNQVEFGGTYFIEKFIKSKNQLTENTAGPSSLIQPKFLSKIEYTANYLDYHFFYLEGFYSRIGFQSVYNTVDQSWFQSLEFTEKFFLRMQDTGNIAFRIHAGIATNNNSPFAPFVIDSHVNLRGAGNRIARGTAQFVANIEYRSTIFEDKLWAVQALVYLDVGTLRNPGGKLERLFDTNQFQQYLGNGLRVIYKKIYGAILRIDYGINIQNVEQRGVVIGLGQYF